MKINCKVNGSEKTWDISPMEPALQLLRRSGYMSIKNGCSEGSCGSCVCLVNGKPVNTCLVPSCRLDGADIVTLEGIGDVEHPHPLQRAFAEEGAVQCGFCSAGAIMSAYALLSENANPCEDDIRRALDGNLCRCTGYVKHIKAVLKAAEEIRGGERE